MIRTVTLLSLCATLFGQGSAQVVGRINNAETETGVRCFHFRPTPEESVRRSGERRSGATRTARANQELPLKAESIKIINAVAIRLDAFSEARREFVDAGNVRSDFTFDLSADLKDVKEKQLKENDIEIAQVLLVAEGSLRYRSGEKLPPEFLEKLRINVPSSFPGWYLEPRLLDLVADSAGDEAAVLAYVESGAMSNPMPRLRRRLLAKMASNAFYLGEAYKARRAYNALEKDFFGTADYIEISKKWMAFAKTFPGRSAPELKLPSLDDEGQVIDLEAMAGKYVLVVFWDTECPNCFAELPNLHNAWDAFKDHSLVLVSVSIGKSYDGIKTIRAGSDFPMPWLHAIAPGGTGGSIAADWGLEALPGPVLVGPDGKVVRTGASLLGENLMETLQGRIGR